MLIALIAYSVMIRASRQSNVAITERSTSGGVPFVSMPLLSPLRQHPNAARLILSASNVRVTWPVEAL